MKVEASFNGIYATVSIPLNDKFAIDSAKDMGLHLYWNLVGPYSTNVGAHGTMKQVRDFVVWCE